MNHSSPIADEYQSPGLTLSSGIGMFISAQWELILGNTYGYTVILAFGLFYAGFGAIITPFFGVTASYGSDTVEYDNALGLWLISKFVRDCWSFIVLTAPSVGCMELILPPRFPSTVSLHLQVEASLR